MSSTIKIKNVIKRYGDVTVIPGLSLDINEGEFFTLLGPSGCGKTTLLRMVAGFNTIEGGDIYFDDRRINDVDPAARSIGMVFQNYAVFPHLNVRKNVEYPLRAAKMAKSKITGLADEYIDLVQMANWAEQMPEKLSGGQQQRIALARALVGSPKVLLMDEPLSNLDAKLRVEMREAIREIQQRIGTTTIYVTHDQDEAMAVSDRIAVMRDGIIQHCGTPQDIYHRPANLFVASFIGNTNQLPATVRTDGENRILNLAGRDFAIPPELIAGNSGDVTVSVRPEHFDMDLEDESGIPGVIRRNVFLGDTTHYIVELNDGNQIEVVRQSKEDDVLLADQQVYVSPQTAAINVFDAETEKNLHQNVRTGVQEEEQLV